MQSKFLALLGGAALSLGLVNAASAADMAARPYTKAAPIAVAMYNWTGFYVGANGGWASSHKCWDYAGTVGVAFAANLRKVAMMQPAARSAARSATLAGRLLGVRSGSAGQLGRSQRLATPAVSPFPALQPTRSQIDAFGLFTGRSATPGTTLCSTSRAAPPSPSDKYELLRHRHRRDCPTPLRKPAGAASVGVGLEYGFTPNWSFGVEYNHMFIGRRVTSPSRVSPASASRVDRIHQDVDMVTARINYRFGGPVVAKY